MLRPPDILRRLSVSSKRVAPFGNKLTDSPRNYYTLTLKTGEFRGSGTMGNIWVNLSGSNGKSGVYTLPFVGENWKHERDAVETHNLDIDSKAIGPLELVKMGLTDAAFSAEGWYLEEVTIKDHINKVVYYFPCHRWLGRSTSFGLDFPTEVKLFPSTVPRGAAVSAPNPISVQCAVNGIPARFKVRNESTRAKISSSFGFAGEDAMFSMRVGNYFYLGVADGVYDWKFKGVYPGVWSRRLIENIKTFCKLGEWELPSEILERAYEKNLIDGIKGSSTACILRINLDTGELISTNVGDSGYVIVTTVKDRNGSVPMLRYRSIEKEHHMGCPHQLGSHNSDTNPLQNADKNSTQLHPGEFLVIATDGVFDNVLGKDIIKIVGESGLSAMDKCCSILNKCYDNVTDKSSDTPFSREASTEMNMIFSGGKDDDMSCLVLQIMPSRKKPA